MAPLYSLVRPYYAWYEYWYRGTTVLRSNRIRVLDLPRVTVLHWPIDLPVATTVLAWDARVVPVDLAYVIFIDFLALGVLRFCFLLLSNVQFLVLVNLPPGLATRVVATTRSTCRAATTIHSYMYLGEDVYSRSRRKPL